MGNMITLRTHGLQTTNKMSYSSTEVENCNVPECTSLNFRTWKLENLKKTFKNIHSFIIHSSFIHSCIKWLRSRKVSILDIFWSLIMLIMQKWDFSGTLDLLQMPLPIIYLHNMRYWIDPRTQFRINWLRSRKNSKKLDFGLKKCQ